jgi:hypothetical protein
MLLLNYVFRMPPKAARRAVNPLQSQPKWLFHNAVASRFLPHVFSLVRAGKRRRVASGIKKLKNNAKDNFCGAK